MTDGSAPFRRSGVQAERTQLSWTRTSLGLMANGVLLLLREVGTRPAPVTQVLAVGALLLAGLVALVGRRRRQQLDRRPLPRPLAVRRQVMLVGWTTTGLMGLTTVGLLLA